MSTEKNVLGILLGTAIGAGLGVLFAPDKGSTTRRRIVKNAGNAADTVLIEAEKLKNNVTAKASDIKNNISESLSTNTQTLEEKLESIVTDASYKADDVMNNLELQLKNLKAKNKKLQ